MRSLKIFLSLVAAVGMLASTAGAADFFVFGKWHAQRGTRVGIPIGNGGNVQHVASAMATQMGTGAPTIVFQTGAFQKAAAPFTIPISQRASIQQLGTSFDGLELRGYDHSSHIRSPSGLWLQTGQG